MIIDELAKCIPDEIKSCHGSVFYSGKGAWKTPCDFYLVGFNPGGEEGTGDRIEDQTRSVLNEHKSNWSAFSDDEWSGHTMGEAPLQLRVQYLFQELGFDYKSVPASNLIFTRSSTANKLGKTRKQRIEQCWPFHQKAVELLKPKAIVCFGIATGYEFSRRLEGKPQLIDTWPEQNRRGWKNRVWKTGGGRLVFGLTHPARAEWRNKKESDPSSWITEVLARNQI